MSSPFSWPARSPRAKRACLAVALLLICLGRSGVSVGADDADVPPPPTETLTVEAVQERLKQVDAAANLDDDAKAKLRETHQRTVKDLEAAGQWTVSADRFDKMAKTAAAELTEAKADLAALTAAWKATVPESPLAQLEQALSEKAAKIKAEKEVLAKLEAEPKRRAERRAAIPKLLVALRDQLAELDKRIDTAGGEAEPSELDLAQRDALGARRRAIQAEMRSHEKELEAYEQRVELLPLRRDVVVARIGLLQQEADEWRKTVDARRRSEAAAQLQRARVAAANAHPSIADLTKRNASWAKQRTDLSPLISRTNGELDNMRKSLEALRDRVKSTKKKVDTIGRTNTIGQLLRKERETIPDLRVHRRSIKDRQKTIGKCQWDLLEVDDRRAELSDIKAEILKHLAGAGQPSGDVSHGELERAARQALQTEKQYVDSLRGDLNSHFDKLVDLGTAEEQLVKEAEEYATYIDERVLWIHSTSLFGRASIDSLGDAAAWLGSPQAWLRLAGALVHDTASRPLPVAILALALTPLVWWRRRLRRKIDEIGTAARRANCCSIAPTLEVVLLIALLGAVVPVVLCFLAWRLSVVDYASDLAEAVAMGLAFVAGIFFLLDSVQQMCRAEGLAEAHFDWPAAALKPVRRTARTAKALLLPLVFIAVAMASQSDNQRADSLGRLAFMATMVVCAAIVRRSLRYDGPIYQAVLTIHGDGWLDRLRVFWYPLLVAAPLSLAGLAAAGYYYTAQQLAGRMIVSAGVLFVLVVARSLLLRWILVKRRRLAIEQSRQRRAAQAESKAADEAGSSEMPVPAEPLLDLATINVQTRNLVRYALTIAGVLGIWLVWVDVLPALGFLDRIPVPMGLSTDQQDGTSLADLILAFLTFATTFVVARNAPGLLEFALLHRSRMDTSFRYSVGAIARYVIIVVGVLIGCHVLGLRWGTVQWLVAAISVGLGFGLQEIFANFVSGIIILFEQPVRVGDVVTVDDITGVISRIRMRATTITNWDRKEFIVPNREFITGRLLNWTLSDQINRVVVNVGIAYGSDTVLATELLSKVAREHPLIVEDPAPRITFEQFGDSSLNFAVRCFLPDMENRLAVIHDLHMTIDREFREAGIEIAFPQQDIHIRSVDAAVPVLRQPSTAGRRPVAQPSCDEDLGDQTEARHVA